MAAPALIAAETEEGIPVGDPLIIAKCGSCHTRDARGNMDRISWERTTPEGWQEAIKKMVLEKQVVLTPLEARAAVRYLSATHGLSPEEARAVMYYPERRIQDESSVSGDDALGACTKCHAAGRPLSWRRSTEDWNKFAETHATQYKTARNSPAFAYLRKTAPLHSPSWDAWNARKSRPDPKGRWLVTARLAGHGRYVGEMQVDAGSSPDEYTTKVTLRSVNDVSILTRTGQSLLFGGYAWRGRSRGSAAANVAPDDPLSETREALWFSPDGALAEGRWFWGQYQEFGFDVEMQRSTSAPTILALDRPSLKVGTKANAIRVLGTNFPAQITTKDLGFGPGVVITRVLSHNSSEIMAEIDVAPDASSGKRDARLTTATLKGALAIYDRVDYVKVTPESSMAGFGSPKYARGFQQFDAVAYQRGPDGKPHTADDLELGPVEATWSMEVFYATDTRNNDKIGKVSTNGLLTPAAENPGVNYDIWVIATAAHETDKSGKPLVGKGYVVVAIPEYTFSGRHYIRDLDRWIEEGTW